MGINGMRYPLLFDLLDDDVSLPRLFELGCFLDFVWADGLLVVFVVSDDRSVVLVVELEDRSELDALAVVAVVDLRVVDVVELFVVVEVDEDEELVDEDELDAVEDDDAAASVISMLRCPSLDSELPSLTTKLKPSTSTPDGAW
jgi:hypothetical protein